MTHFASPGVPLDAPALQKNFRTAATKIKPVFFSEVVIIALVTYVRYRYLSLL